VCHSRHPESYSDNDSLLRSRTRKNGQNGPTESTSYRGKNAFCDQRYQKVKELLKTKGNEQNAVIKNRCRKQESLHHAARNCRDGQRSETRSDFAMLSTSSLQQAYSEALERCKLARDGRPPNAEHIQVPVQAWRQLRMQK
jgi:hypothetical protein